MGMLSVFGKTQICEIGFWGFGLLSIYHRGAQNPILMIEAPTLSRFLDVFLDVDPCLNNRSVKAPAEP